MGKGFGMEQKGSDNNVYRAQNLCYSHRWLHRCNMGKGFGMEQEGTDNNVYIAQKPLLQQQMAP